MGGCLGVYACMCMFTCTSMCMAWLYVYTPVFMGVGVCLCVCMCGCTGTYIFACVCVCVGVWVVAPFVCGVCVERQRSLVPILYRLLISECVVAKCFLFLFSSRESIPWFLSVPRGRTRPPHMSRYLCVYTISYI